MCGWRLRRWREALRALLIAGVFIASGAGNLSAHEGPPFPLTVDQPLAGYKVSVWADPDIGDAQFYVIVETLEGEQPEVEPVVSLWTQPRSKRLPRATYPAERQVLRNQLQFQANPYFDQRDWWVVGVNVTPPRGQASELTLEVESTPPGYGPWDLAIYLFPFLLLGILWLFAMLRRRQSIRSASLRASTPQMPDSASVSSTRNQTSEPI